MNLKSLITVAAVATAGAALAAYESPVKLCQIKVDSAYTNTILALPLVNVGNDGDTVNPTNMILTAGLKAGTYLYTNTGKSKAAGWVIETDGGPWEVANVVNVTEQSAEGSASRGTGVWLSRPAVEAGQNQPSVYIYGQISTNAVTMQAKVNGFTMMGNPNTTNISINAINWSTPPSLKDEIEVLNDTEYGAVTYVWKVPTKGEDLNDGNPCWCVETLDMSTRPWKISAEKASKDFKPGEGFWYRNTSSSNTPTVTWSAEK